MLNVINLNVVILASHIFTDDEQIERGRTLKRESREPAKSSRKRTRGGNKTILVEPKDPVEQDKGVASKKGMHYVPKYAMI